MLITPCTLTLFWGYSLCAMLLACLALSVCAASHAVPPKAAMTSLDQCRTDLKEVCLSCNQRACTPCSVHHALNLGAKACEISHYPAQHAMLRISFARLAYQCTVCQPMQPGISSGNRGWRLPQRRVCLAVHRPVLHAHHAMLGTNDEAKAFLRFLLACLTLFQH
jgi:hypothetical protein